MSFTDTPAQTPLARLERLEHYLASDPGNLPLLAEAIDLSLAMGNIGAASKHAGAALAQAPGDPFFEHRNGNVLIAQGRLDEAAAVFEDLAARVGDAAIAYNLAYVRYRQGQYDLARQALESHMAAGEPSPATVTLLMRVLHQLHELEPAIALVELHMARCGSDADFLAVASLLYLDSDQLTQAQRLGDAALALGKRPLEALVVAGSVALARADAAGAGASFTEALSVHLSDGRSWSGLGMASLLQGDLEKAGQQLKRALGSMPAHIGTWHALGWCQILQRQLADADQTFRTALTLDRNFGESHGGLAVVQALQGHKASAEESIARALHLDPQSLSAKYAQMVLAGDTNDSERFRKLAQRILLARSGPFGGSLADALNKRKLGV